MSSILNLENFILVRKNKWQKRNSKEPNHI